LDEPNTGLDPQGILDLRKLMLQLNQEEGKTILFSSHILSEVQEICNRMVVINRGQKVSEGSVRELLSEEVLHVRIEAVDAAQLKSVVANSLWHQKISGEENGLLLFNLNKKEIPELVQFLQQAQVSLLRVDYKNPLEEYFLKITQNQA
jgi:ABC-2 type transport system ATP-binding protein